MTVLRMIMPASAINPSSATKPTACWRSSIGAGCADQAERCRDEHQRKPREALQLDH